MGEIHDLRCSKCGYGIKAMVGIGMLYSPEQIFYGPNPALSELVQDKALTKQALTKISAGKRVDDDYGHFIYACPNDFYLFDKFYFKIDDWEPEYPCPYGDGILKRLIFAKGQLGTTRLKFVDDSGYWHCPKCGNDSLNEVSFANWD